jgi:large subunit ribosomal protein L21
VPSSSGPLSAVVVSGGKQYRVASGDRILVDRVAAEPGARLTLDRVLMVVEGGEVKLGADALSGQVVTARVLAHRRGPKIEVLRYRPKKHVRVHRGARADLTALEILAIGEPLPEPEPEKPAKTRAKGSRGRARPRRAAVEEEPEPAAEAAEAAEIEAEATAEAATETEAEAAAEAATETEAEAAAVAGPEPEATEAAEPEAAAGAAEPEAAAEEEGGGPPKGKRG